jgi:mono/diheme cytochrome c family protein
LGRGKGALAKIIGAPKVGFTKGLSIKYLRDNELISVIRNGKGDFMPGWGGTLDEDEIIDTASYVRSLNK